MRQTIPRRLGTAVMAVALTAGVMTGLTATASLARSDDADNDSIADQRAVNRIQDRISVIPLSRHPDTDWLPTPAGGFRVLWRLYGTDEAQIPGVIDETGWRTPALLPAG